MSGHTCRPSERRFDLLELERFDDIEVRLFTSRIRRGSFSADSYASAAMFTAPGNPRLLVIMLGDTNSETDRVGGIRLEETLHQVLRGMERADN